MGPRLGVHGDRELIFPRPKCLMKFVQKPVGLDQPVHHD